MNLNPRERRLILIGALVLASAASFEWLIDPLLSTRATLATTLPALRAQSAQLAQYRTQLQDQAAAAKAARVPLSESALRDSLSRAGLTPDTVRLEGNGAQLNFTRADLGAVLRWASDAEPAFALGVKKLEARMAGEGERKTTDLSVWLAP